MRLDEYLMRTKGFESITLPAVLIAEKQVLVNEKPETNPAFPLTPKDVVALKDESLKTKGIPYWNLRHTYDGLGLRVTDDVLSFGLDAGEMELFLEKKHALMSVCLEQEKASLPAGVEALVANPFHEELSRKTKYRYNIFAFGPRFDSFRIGKIVDMNKDMLVSGSKLLIKLQGDEKDVQGQRAAINIFAETLGMKEQLFLKLPYGRFFSLMILERRFL